MVCNSDNTSSILPPVLLIKFTYDKGSMWWQYRALCKSVMTASHTIPVLSPMLTIPIFHILIFLFTSPLVI